VQGPLILAWRLVAPTDGTLLIRGASLGAEGRPVDVRTGSGVILALAGHLDRHPGEEVLDARGCRLLPGLHDHHVHLRAAAAAAGSLVAGPPDVLSASQLEDALHAADRRLAAGQWIRAVGYHESVAGDLDRWQVDRWVGGRPVRLQHRSGMLWVLNSAALAAIGALVDGRAAGPEELERDASGTPTGRLWRGDAWLRSRLPDAPLDLGALSRAAASRGVTGFTDATPQASAADVDGLAEAAASGVVAQRIHAMTGPGVALRPGPTREAEAGSGDRLTAGPVKFLLDDERLPALDEMADQIRWAHAARRPVAVHCVTRVQATLTVAAIEATGGAAGDRIEHGAVLGADLLAAVRSLGLTVVTQPGLVRTRGDRYFEDVDDDDRGDLWRLASLRAAGIAVAAGSDGPFGPQDPWVSVRAAVDRLTASGRPLGASEAVAPEVALSLFLGHPEAPGRRRRVEPGEPADLCLLAGPLESWPPVAATLLDGRIIYRGEI
jgi:predicted amidohydrolase YtcJ